MTGASIDQLLISANEVLRVIPPGTLQAARRIQDRDKEAGIPLRTLLDILRAEGWLNSEVERKLQSYFSPSLELPPLPTPELARDSVLKDAPDSILDLAAAGARSAPPPPFKDPVARLDSAPPAPDSPKTPASAIVRPVDVEKADQDVKNHMGHFVLLKEAGRGGMGTVYRAWDNRLGRYVALKVLHDSSPESVDRFVREAHIAGKLNHPAIASVHEVGEHQSRFYIAMQFIDGQPLGRKPRPIKATLELIRDAARALHFAHEKGIVHRDIKPGNLLVTEEHQVFITDFGLAKQVSGVGGSQLSVSGMIVGTPEFMSPEQAQGQTSSVDARSDVYSLGSTLYMLLAGHAPFSNPNMIDLLVAVVEAPPTPLRGFNSAVSPELEAVVEKSMAKRRQDRFASAAAFADELDRLIREGRYAGRYGLTRWLAKRWWRIAAGGVLLGLAIRFLLPMFFERPIEGNGGSNETAAGLYAAASRTLRGVEQDFARLPGEERQTRIARDVLKRTDRALLLEPKHLPSRVLKARALYLAGRAAEAAAELKALDPDKRRDYRIPFLTALAALEGAVGEPPLPALEAPVPDWEGRPPAWPESILSNLKAALATPVSSDVDPSMAEQFKHDVTPARALVNLGEQRWAEAASALGDVIKIQKIPIYGAAWVRAAYMARHFEEVRDSPLSDGRRERRASAMALLAAASRPEEEWAALLKECAADPEAAVLIRAALARRAVAAGRDPEPHVKAALDLGVAGERRGVILASRLRRLALSGRDDEDLYKDALGLLGEAPGSWMARQALPEVKLGLAARRARRGGDGRALLDDVLKSAGALAEQSEGWAFPRVLRGLALLRQGKPVEAWAPLDPLIARSKAEPAAVLAAAAVWLDLADQRRRGGAPLKDEAARSLEYALAALGALPHHPEALNLAAAASVVLAEEAASRGEDASKLVEDALEKLRLALERAPGYVEALYHRGNALFLKGDAASAERDLDAALGAVPEFAAARYLRGVIRYSRRQFASAAEDWEEILRSHPAWDSPDLRAWIRRAGEKGKK